MLYADLSPTLLNSWNLSCFGMLFGGIRCLVRSTEIARTLGMGCAFSPRLHRLYSSHECDRGSGVRRKQQAIGPNLSKPQVRRRRRSNNI